MKFIQIIGLSVLVTLSLLIPPAIFGFNKISHLLWVDWFVFFMFISGGLFGIDLASSDNRKVKRKTEDK